MTNRKLCNFAQHFLPVMRSYNDIITYRDTLYKQGQLGVTVIDTVGTAVSGPLLLFQF